MNDELLKALGSAVGGGVVSGALLLILYKVGARIVERLIAAIDRLGTNVDRLGTNVTDHTKVDLQHHADVREAVVRVEAKVDAVLDERERTPVEGFERVSIEDSQSKQSRRRARTPLQRPTFRSPRPGTHNDD